MCKTLGIYYAFFDNCRYANFPEKLIKKLTFLNIFKMGTISRKNFVFSYLSNYFLFSLFVRQNDYRLRQEVAIFNLLIIPSHAAILKTNATCDVINKGILNSIQLWKKYIQGSIEIS